MALEDLLRTEDRREDGRSAALSEPREKGSLIEQAAAVFGRTGEAADGPEEETPPVTVCYADGYEQLVRGHKKGYTQDTRP